MPEDKPVFELIRAPVPDIGALFRLRYGSSANDPRPFILTVTPQFVALETGKALPVPVADMTDYVRRNADKLKGIASFQKGRGLTGHTLE